MGRRSVPRKPLVRPALQSPVLHTVSGLPSVLPVQAAHNLLGKSSVSQQQCSRAAVPLLRPNNSESLDRLSSTTQTTGTSPSQSPLILSRGTAGTKRANIGNVAALMPSDVGLSRATSVGLATRHKSSLSTPPTFLSRSIPQGALPADQRGSCESLAPSSCLVPPPSDGQLLSGDCVVPQTLMQSSASIWPGVLHNTCTPVSRSSSAPPNKGCGTLTLGSPICRIGCQAPAAQRRFLQRGTLPASFAPAMQSSAVNAAVAVATLLSGTIVSTAAEGQTER